MRQRHPNQKPLWRIPVLLALGLVFVLSAYQAGGILLDSHSRTAAFAALAQQAEVHSAASPSTGLSRLREQNPHLFGWLSIPDTPLDYPVMYTPDQPEYYLRRAFDQSSSLGGVPFVGEGYQPDGRHTMIYGHNMKDGTMFATLLSYADQEFWEQHPTILLDTPEASRRYQVLAAFYTQLDPPGEEAFRFHQHSDLGDPAAFQSYLRQVQAAALYPTGVQAEPTGQLLTLSTCSYHTRDGRFVVVAYCPAE